MNRSVYEQLLSSAPGSCADMRKELEGVHGFKVSGATYSSIWKNLIAYFGDAGAPTVVEDIVDIRAARHALVKQVKCKQWEADLYLADRLTRAKKRGQQLLRSANASRQSAITPVRKKRKRIINHDHITLPGVDYGLGPEQSQAIGYHPIEQSRPEGPVRMKARSTWLEKHLEDHIEKNWGTLDFGLDRGLALCGRQIHLSDTKERVDLLARTGGIVLPIELKIKRAGGSDLTQLQSYRQDLINQGHAPENVLGVLIAPQFSSKVLNVVSGTNGVVLRWYEMPL